MLNVFVAAQGAYHETKATMGAQQDAARANHAAKRTEQQVKLLEANLAKSLMICETLWELLADLINKLNEVDMRDGVLDGKNQRGIAECAACGRKVSGRHAACLYCGEVIDGSVFNPG